MLLLRGWRTCYGSIFGGFIFWAKVELFVPTGIAGGSLFTIGRTGRDATKLYALYLSFEHLRESLRLCFLCIGIIKIPDKPKRPAARSGVRICLAWSGLRDLNPRSLGPKPSAIPNFAKPGRICVRTAAYLAPQRQRLLYTTGSGIATGNFRKCAAQNFRECVAAA